MSKEEDLTCFICKQVYMDPVLLPCNSNICHLHSIHPNIRCLNCHDIHIKTDEGFPKCEKGNELSLNFYKKLNNRKVNESITKFQNIINELESIANNPCLFINDYFDNLRDKAVLATEKSIQLIEVKQEKCINQLNELEAKCKVNAEKIRSIYSEKLNQAQRELDSLNEARRNYDLTKDPIMRKLSDKTIVKALSMNYLITKYKNDLLQNTLCKFESLLEIEYDLQINDLNETDKVTLEFSIDDFMSFSQSYDYFDSTEWQVAKGMYWKIHDIVIEKEYSKYTLSFEIIVNYDYTNTHPKKIEKTVQIYGLYSNGESKLMSSENVADESFSEFGGSFSYFQIFTLYENEDDFMSRAVDKLNIRVDISIVD